MFKKKNKQEKMEKLQWNETPVLHPVALIGLVINQPSAISGQF